jgi:hypothetical protein
MRELFPGKKLASYSTTDGDDRQYPMEELDWKATVVCDTCNNGWMSDIEAQHAKPVLTPLITGQQEIPIGLPAARSIALFAFKTALVLDSVYNRGKETFFDRSQRYKFKEELSIPASVRMWLCPYAGNRTGGRFVPLFLKEQFPSGNYLEMYICTFALGHIAVQVVSAKVSGIVTIDPTLNLESLAVPFWPELYPGYVWPGNVALLSRQEFISFAYRWGNVKVTFSN